MVGIELSRGGEADWLERRRGAAPPRFDLEGRSARALAGGVGILVFLTIWEATSRTGVLPSDSFPPATTVLGDLWSALGRSATWDAISATMTGWAWGLLIGVPLAVVLGVVIGMNDTLYAMVRPIIEFLRPVPSVALIPLGVLLFGVEMRIKVFLVVYAVFFPMLYQAIYGVRSTDRVALETAEVYGLGRLGRTARVVLPSAAPYLMTGLRLASSIALVLCVTAELIVGTTGVGDLIGSAEALGDYSNMYAFILVTGILGIVLNAVFRLIDRRVVWWTGERRAGRSA